MKNIIEICKDFGLEIPADKQAEFGKVVAENYKTVAEFEKKVNRLQEDLETANKRADTAEETLKGFEGKDFEAITRERDDWKKKHDENEAAYKKANEEREFNELLSSSISEAKGKNAKAITALLDVEKLRGSRNQKADIEASLESLRKESGYLFEDNGGNPVFSGNKGSADPGTATRKEILAITDPAERQAKIAANIHLFQKG